MTPEENNNRSLLMPKIAAITIVILFIISIVGNFIQRLVSQNNTGSTCTFEQIRALEPECLKYIWTTRGHNGRLELFFSFLDALAIALMIPVFQGFKKIIKDTKSADFMIGCAKIAVVFSVFNTIFSGAAREYASMRAHADLTPYYPEYPFHCLSVPPPLITNNLFSWIGSVDELLFTIVFLYMAALGSSTKIFPIGFNITSLVLAITSFLAFIFGILYLLWDSLLFVECISSLPLSISLVIVRIIYFFASAVWIFWAFYFFRTMA